MTTTAGCGRPLRTAVNARRITSVTAPGTLIGSHDLDTSRKLSAALKLGETKASLRG